MDDQENIRPIRQRRERPLLLPCFYFIEVPLFGTVAVLAYMLHFTTVFETYATSFNPSELSLSRPYTPVENRTVSTQLAFMGSTLVPCALVLAVEFVLLVSAICFSIRTEPPIGSTGCYIGTSIRRIVRFIGVFLFGLLVTSALADVLRKNGPALSPHFLSVCKPEGDKSQSDPTSVVHEISVSSYDPDPLKKENRFFSDDCLTILGVEELQNARLESPSYLVCLTTYAATYTLLYFQHVMAETGPVLKTVVAWSILSLPYVIGLLETAENTSHLTSVLYGWILGGAVAYLLSHEIFSISFVHRCKCPKICRRRSTKDTNTEANNVFEDAATPKFSMHKYKVTTDDIVSVSSNRDDQKDAKQWDPQGGSRITLTLHSPAVSKKSQSVCDAVKDHHKGHTAERKVIKELQDYITDTDFRGGLESPKPTQIRELTRGLGKNRKQVFSTFQATPESEVGGEIEIAGSSEQEVPDDLHAPASAKNSPSYKLPANFQEPLCPEIRPFSYHDRRSSQSSDGSHHGNRLCLPGNEGRPVSYSFLPRNLNNDWKNLSATTHEIGQPERSSFSSDEESGSFTLKGSSIEEIPPSVSEMPRLHSNANDVIKETSNLLREVFNVMSDKEDGDSNSDDRSSDETITEDQPSIAV